MAVQLSRRAWLLIECVVVIIVAFSAILWVENHMPKEQRIGLQGVIVTALVLYFRNVQAVRQGEKNEEILHQQNKTLGKIEGQVNGGTTRTLDAIREDHNKALDFMREQWRVERHDLLGKLNTKELQLIEAQTECKAAVEKAAMLEKQIVGIQQTARDLAAASKKAE